MMVSYTCTVAVAGCQSANECCSVVRLSPVREQHFRNWNNA